MTISTDPAILETAAGGADSSGRPTRRIVSGAMHYPRTHPAQWRARLEALQYMGLDTVETFVPWNLHEPRPGEFRFDGLADLEGFLDVAAELGMDAIVRPGPYGCAEWDNGGLPSWLTGRPGVRVRTSDPAFLDAVDRWFDELIPRIAARQVTRGGNVTMVQIENEYGSFGSDKTYLRHLRDGLLRRGIEVPLFTSDGPSDICLSVGTVEGAVATLNFGSGHVRAFEALARHRPEDAPFCMEFWNGWFDHWGTAHHTRESDSAAAELDQMLAAGASVNIYMAHGGTSFGCTSGANDDGHYLPTVTSYDYDAPLDERGAPTPKFWAFREAIGRHTELPATPAPDVPPTLPATSIHIDEHVDLRAHWQDLASAPQRTPHPPTFEELGVDHGLVRYRTVVAGPRPSLPLTLVGLADRAHVYADGAFLGIVLRDEPYEIELAVPAGGAQLEVIVESMGRVNYGPVLGERKGLVGGVLHQEQFLHDWETSVLALPESPTVAPELLRALDDDEVRVPALLRGTLEVDVPLDGFLALDGWGKGYVWVNGFCLGRYWDRGPQRTLYVPGPVLTAGANEIVVLELDRMGGDLTIEERADLAAAVPESPQATPS